MGVRVMVAALRAKRGRGLGRGRGRGRGRAPSRCRRGGRGAYVLMSCFCVHVGGRGGGRGRGSGRGLTCADSSLPYIPTTTRPPTARRPLPPTIRRLVVRTFAPKAGFGFETKPNARWSERASSMMLAVSSMDEDGHAAAFDLRALERSIQNVFVGVRRRLAAPPDREGGGFLEVWNGRQMTSFCDCPQPSRSPAFSTSAAACRRAVRRARFVVACRAGTDPGFTHETTPGHSPAFVSCAAGSTQ